MFFGFLDDEPSTSPDLVQNLVRCTQQAFSSQRPVLIHLNADTSWLLILPVPHSARGSSSRTHFNILIDPWLRGRQSDVSWWFSSQWHAYASSVQSIQQLNDILCQSQGTDGSAVNFVDAVLVSHEFTDHCHQATLLEVDPGVPVFAATNAATLIQSWKHFETILEPAAFSPQQNDWRLTTSPTLPSWLGLSRIVTEGNALYYHSAMMITFDLETERGTDIESVAEAVIYTPHGIHARDLSCLGQASPPVRTLALMHGLHDVKVSMKQLNLGAHNGLQAQRICNAHYWVATHDEVKTARGFIAPMLFRKALTLKDALEAEQKREAALSEERDEVDLDKVNFAELQSGECIILD